MEPPLTDDHPAKLDSPPHQEVSEALGIPTRRNALDALDTSRSQDSRREILDTPTCRETPNDRSETGPGTNNRSVLAEITANNRLNVSRSISNDVGDDTTGENTSEEEPSHTDIIADYVARAYASAEISDFKMYLVDALRYRDIPESVIIIDHIPVNVIGLTSYGFAGKSYTYLHLSPREHMARILEFMRIALKPTGFWVTNTLNGCEQMACDFAICCATDHTLLQKSIRKDPGGTSRVSFQLPICGDLLRFVFIYASDWPDDEGLGTGFSILPDASEYRVHPENPRPQDDRVSKYPDVSKYPGTHGRGPTPVSFSARLELGRSYTEIGEFRRDQDVGNPLPAPMNMMGVLDASKAPSHSINPDCSMMAHGSSNDQSNHALSLVIVIPQYVDAQWIHVSLGWIFLNPEMRAHLRSLDMFI